MLFADHATPGLGAVQEEERQEEDHAVLRTEAEMIASVPALDALPLNAMVNDAVAGIPTAPTATAVRDAVDEPEPT